ncbi:hypothetical protein R0381_003219 [Jeongeupia wiesaeckerbachi]|uniref:hypothetical protein n=1 Tax=Jeongeupia wiesaeckerbachi TaxID=3051218 RepID=UPI003D800795
MRLTQLPSPRLPKASAVSHLAGLELRTPDAASDEVEFGQRLLGQLNPVVTASTVAEGNDHMNDDWSDRLIFTLMHNVNRQRSNEPAIKSHRQLSDTYQNTLAPETQRQHALA